MSDHLTFDEIEQLLNNNQTFEALNQLMDYTKEMRCLNQVILLKVRWNHNEKEGFEKVVTTEFYEVTKRRINKDIRELNNSLKNSKWETKPYSNWQEVAFSIFWIILVVLFWYLFIK